MEKLLIAIQTLDKESNHHTFNSPVYAEFETRPDAINAAALIAELNETKVRYTFPANKFQDVTMLNGGYITHSEAIRWHNQV